MQIQTKKYPISISMITNTNTQTITYNKSIKEISQLPTIPLDTSKMACMKTFKLRLKKLIIISILREAKVLLPNTTRIVFP